MRIVYVLISTLLLAALGVLAVAGIAAQHAPQLSSTLALLKAEAAHVEHALTAESRRVSQLAGRLALDPALVLEVRTLSALAAPPPSGKMPEPRRLRVEALRSKLTTKLTAWRSEHAIEGAALVDAGGRVLATDGTVFKVGTRLHVAPPPRDAQSEGFDFGGEVPPVEDSAGGASADDLDPRLTLTALTGPAQQAAFLEAGAVRLVGVAALASKTKPAGAVIVQVGPVTLAPTHAFLLVDGKIAAGKPPPGFNVAEMSATSEPFLVSAQPATANVPGLGVWPLGPLFVPHEQIGIWAQRFTVPGIGDGAVFADMTPRQASLAGMQMLILLLLLGVVAAHMVILFVASRRAPARALLPTDAQVAAAATEIASETPPPLPPDAGLEFQGIRNAGSVEASPFDLKTGEIASSRMQSLLAEAQTAEDEAAIDAEADNENEAEVNAAEPLDTASRPAMPAAPDLDDETQVISARPNAFDAKADTVVKAPAALELSQLDESETRIMVAPQAEAPPEESMPAAVVAAGTPELHALFGELDSDAASELAPSMGPELEPADNALFAEPLGAFAAEGQELSAEFVVAPKASEAVASKSPAPETPEAAAPKPPEVAAPKPPEVAAPKPPEAAAPRPPEAAAPRPPGAAAGKSPEAAAPKPPSVAAAFAASLASKSAPVATAGDAPTVVTHRANIAVAAKPETTVKPVAPVARPAAPATAPTAAAKPVSGDPAHFRKVFDEFVATRKSCGESTADLTFEKFSAKLVASRDAVMAKHNCSDVRFEVYVKDGKAALKALPAR